MFYDCSELAILKGGGVESDERQSAHNWLDTISNFCA